MELSEWFFCRFQLNPVCSQWWSTVYTPAWHLISSQLGWQLDNCISPGSFLWWWSASALANVHWSKQVTGQTLPQRREEYDHLFMGLSLKSPCKTVEGKEFWLFLRWTEDINISSLCTRFWQSHYGERTWIGANNKLPHINICTIK